MMFEPRSRGFSDPLLGQPFYGWYCAPLAPGFFSALGRHRRPGPRLLSCREIIAFQHMGAYNRIGRRPKSNTAG